MAEILFTADTHLGHQNILEFEGGRTQYKTIEEHDEDVIFRWNRAVRPGDLVYHLGDVAFVRDVKTLEKYLSRLNGTIHLIKGNHDQRRLLRRLTTRKIAWWGDYKEIKIDGKKIVLFHWPIEIWNQRQYQSWHLHGHSHGGCPSKNHVLRQDVGWDVWYQPVHHEALAGLVFRHKKFRFDDYHINPNKHGGKQNGRIENPSE